MTYKEFMYTLMYVSRYISYLEPQNLFDVMFLRTWQALWYLLERYTTVGV